MRVSSMRVRITSLQSRAELLEGRAGDLEAPSRLCCRVAYADCLSIESERRSSGDRNDIADSHGARNSYDRLVGLPVETLFLSPISVTPMLREIRGSGPSVVTIWIADERKNGESIRLCARCVPWYLTPIPGRGAHSTASPTRPECCAAMRFASHLPRG